MKRVLWLMAPLALFAGQARYARLGEFNGKVEVQLQAADAWMAAERNLPLTDSAWLRTAGGARAEVELDDGNTFRLSADSQAELSDYTRLSTGQRLTVLSVDHGVAYFTGEPNGKDNITLVVPGAQITLIGGARVRLDVDVTAARVAVIEGVVRLSCPAAEIDLREGQTGFVDPTNPARFSLERGVKALDSDGWSEQRDKALMPGSSAARVAQRIGVTDLDAAGEWVQTDAGAAWKPKVAEGWAPFRLGRWRWYDGLGYTWVSDEAWGWVPYHYGRWLRHNDLGWVWMPGTSTVFKPGEVYWLQSGRLAGWGPLAPGEQWRAMNVPAQFQAAATTYANFTADARVIDPAGLAERPQQTAGGVAFALALPSPAVAASRLDAVRPTLRVGATRMDLVIPGTTFEDANQAVPAAPVPPPATVTNPEGDAPPPVVLPGAPGDPGPAGPPMQVMYPPVYPGVVVVNPPDHPSYGGRNPNVPVGRPGTPPAGGGTTTNTPTTPTTTPDPPRTSRPIPVLTPREPPRELPHPVMAPSEPRPAAPRVEAPRPETPRVQAPAPRVEAPRPEAPRPPPPPPPQAKAETKTETKTDTPTKKQ